MVVAGLGCSGGGEKSAAVRDATIRGPGTGRSERAAFYPTPTAFSGRERSLTTASTAVGLGSAALARVRIVLVEPSHPGNVGAAARAMKVMGLSRLLLVAPRHADVTTRPDAIAFASGAVDLLDRASTHATLDDALAGCTHAIAMSAREREYAPPPSTLREAAAEAVLGVADVAFVFGSERYGLSNDDVLRCQARCRVDTSAAYGSLNLAQAVQLVAYECRLAAMASADAATTMRAAPLVVATHEEREALIDHLERGLLAIGYLDPANPKKLMPRLRRLFARAHLEHDEVQWLRGIAKAMLRSDT